MRYLSHDHSETGREAFSVSVLSDGSRTLRATCEMDDFGLLRDVVQSLDSAWHPTDAYVRLAVGGRHSGAAWYRFRGGEAECHGLLAKTGPFEDVQSIDRPIQSFGSHALHADAWLIARVRACGGDLATLTGASFTTSLSAHGGSGPALLRVPPARITLRDFGIEQVKVPAGCFEAHHVRVELSEVDSFDIWASGQDCVPVRLSSDGLGQYYELVELEGDVR
jgi:hypothetical protein